MKYSVRKSAEVKMRLYNGSKYEAGTEVSTDYIYSAGRVESFEVVTKSDEEIYNEGFDEVDPNGEYLILTLDGGETATFRNSFTDMFIH